MYTYTYTRMHRTVHAQVRGDGGGLETCESMEEGVRDLRMIEATRISSGARSGLVAREAAQLNVGHKDSETNLKSQYKDPETNLKSRYKDSDTNLKSQCPSIFPRKSNRSKTLTVKDSATTKFQTLVP
jgi:hypothetical protein